jgi:pilus assembly protein CpaC
MRKFLIATVAIGLLLPAVTRAASPVLSPGIGTPMSNSSMSAPSNAPAGTGANLIVEAGSGRVVTLPAPVTNVFVSDPKIVEVRPASPTSLFLFGVGAGRTTVAALDANGVPVRSYEVTVRPSSFGANQAAGVVARTEPNSNVRIETEPKRMVMTGKLATPADAQAAVQAATGFTTEGQTVENRTQVNQQIQVGLHVRIAEMNRTVTRALGINWTALGTFGKLAMNFATTNPINAFGAVAGGTLGSVYNDNRGNVVNNLIDALAADNLIRVLAEPNLTAMSGETASFLVGGEFPIPVSEQNNTISVEFKQYGIALAFVPTVMSEDRIRIHVRPEVSQLTTVGAVSVSVGATSIQIPALTVRRADTTIELGSGQSFAMAGLLLDNTNQQVNALPGLGEIPILGALFRSDSYQKNETELVIIVTPYIVHPVNSVTALRDPTQGTMLPNDIERLLWLKQVVRSSPATAQRVPGQAGFVVE